MSSTPHRGDNLANVGRAQMLERFVTPGAELNEVNLDLSGRNTESAAHACTSQVPSRDGS